MKSGNVYLIPVWVACMLTLVGCKRAVDWATSNFNQGTTSELPTNKVKPYIKSVVVHSQLSTRGIFDALWLADIVRTASTDVLIMRAGKSLEQHRALLRRQLEENKHYIMFYVVTEYDVPLGDCAQWQLFLRIGDQNYQPRELKVIDLPCEYKAFFGTRFGKTKIAYLAKFDAQDSNEKPIVIPNQTESIMLCVRSVEKQATLEWPLDETGKKIKDT
jgi:hypothetical protein